MSDEKQYCECDLRNRQWNGAGRCLTCGNRYIDPRDPMTMPTKAAQVNHMPKGRERPTGPCDCGRIEHGRHHADCPASGVSYSDKYLPAAPAAGDHFVDANKMVVTNDPAGFAKESRGDSRGGLVYTWQPPAIDGGYFDTPKEYAVVRLDAYFGGCIVYGFSDRWYPNPNLRALVMHLLEERARLTAANAELARDRDAEKEHADRLAREVSAIARESMDRQMTLAKLEAEVIASRDIVKAAESERDAARAPRDELAPEKFIARGIGQEWNSTCVVTGIKERLMPNLSAFVTSREAGERIVKMFGGRAYLDYRPNQPNHIQVKIGALPELRAVLERIGCATHLCGNTIYPQLIEWAIHPNEAPGYMPPGYAAHEEAKRLREALTWYAEQVDGCRKLGHIGDPYRQALDRDGGKRARAALSAVEQKGV